MRILETIDENSEAVELFRDKLEEVSYMKKDLEWGFPNGERLEYPTYLVKTHLGELQIGVPDSSLGNRIPHFVRFAKDDNAPPSPDVELNTPREHDRRISGVYVKDGDEIWLCSRGSFTAYRGQIKRDLVFSFFENWLYQVNDSGTMTLVIPVCSLSSPTISNDIAEFTFAVQELKQLYKKNSSVISLSKPDKNNKFSWKHGKEFEGSKNSGSRVGSEYEYIHGPLCNQLKRYLELAVLDHQVFKVVKNSHVDIAIIDKKTDVASIIFEVKTAPLPSNQVYTAVGQLFYYRTLYGNEETDLYLVLPVTNKSSATEKFVESLKINLIYGKEGKFYLPKGDEYQVLSGHVASAARSTSNSPAVVSN